ncbi:MAG: patatin-like phospholipase family protein [Myxococcales bacterium]|nr:patatin-like phospholipase family protein [Myxococcales bacterium]MCB9628482.1 patatin-like phospholipase family protein [Sandaracinaceae bacterium]
MKRALVLSSGGSRGQFHVGAVRHLMGDLGQHYDIFAGVSVGALIAGFLAQYPQGEEQAAAEGLTELFTPLSNKHIYRPWRMGLMSGFWKSSLYDATPLRELLRTAVDVERVRANGKQLLFGATSLTTGAYRLFSQEDEPFHDLLYASAAFPVAFDPIHIGDELWTDGGIRAVTPLGAAIRAGADAVDMLLLTPTNPTPRFDPTASAIEVGLRCLDIMLDEIVDNDAKMAAMMNRLIAEGGTLPGKRHVDIRIIRPAEELPVVSHVFDPQHAASIQALGYETAKAALGSR